MNNYKTSGVCAKEISFLVENDIVTQVIFKEGCAGNLKGIGALVQGMKVDDVISKIKDTKCGQRDTSCPDQLAKALANWKAQQ